MADGTPYVHDLERTALVIAYRNKRLIADQVAPYSTVGKKAFKYSVFEQNAHFTVPETFIGRRSEANEVEYSDSEVIAECVDNGLSTVVIDEDQDNAPKGKNLLDLSATATMDLVLLRREIEIAQMYNDGANYDHVYELGSSAEHLKLDDPNCDPLPYFLELLDEPLIRPNALTINNLMATKLRTNANVLKGYHGTTDGKGLVPLEYIKEQLELEHVFIGSARHNTAKKGEQMNMQKCWVDSLSFTYHDPLADLHNRRMTFALTARYGNRTVKSKRISAGLGEGTKQLVGESTKPLSIAPGCGLLLTSPLGYVAA